MRKERVAEFDMLKGIGMLMVIIGHSFYIWPIYHVFNQIHMPLFFIVSGYFFSCRGAALGGVILKNLNKLVLPYILVSLCVFLLLLMFRNHNIGYMFLKESLVGATIPNSFEIPLGPLWFFLALFWCKILYRLVFDRLGFKFTAVVVIVIPVCLILVNRVTDIYTIPYQISQGLLAMFYYHIGVVIRKENGTTALANKKKSDKMLLIGTEIVVLAFVAIYYKIIGSNMNLSALYFPAMPIDYMNAILAFIALYLGAEYMLRKRQLNYLNSLLLWIGKGSMVIYVIHCIEYHATIPFMNGITTQMLTLSKTAYHIALLANPVSQIAMCMMGLYMYERCKIHLANENRNCNNLV